ncbi:hypothetical protein MKX01_005760 [Papaver californicum]|nr:hypothetical protein MKX01_005760 [Papaver californicum]
MRTHLSRAPSIIVAQSFEQSSDHDIKLYLFDENAKIVKATSLDLGFSDAYCRGPIRLCGSYGGFLLFKSKNGPKPVFCAWNPVTKEQVILISPWYPSHVCGFYFHPRKKEYEVLCISVSDRVIFKFLA